MSVRRPILRISDSSRQHRSDTLAGEEPLEIRINGAPLTITMRTAGHDSDLALGFLVSEGVIHRSTDVIDIRYCAGATTEEGNTYNVLDIRLADGVALPDRTLTRNFYTTSSCGVCGKASLEAVRTDTTWPAHNNPLTVTAETLSRLPNALRDAQRVFATTGGLHAAALATATGDLTCVREDVGRHNAVDKVIGEAVRGDLLPLESSILLVSGRVSFELVQKAVMAGIPILAAVSAPSSLAIDLATAAGLTVIGFLRGPTMNIYCGEHRVI